MPLTETLPRTPVRGVFTVFVGAAFACSTDTSAPRTEGSDASVLTSDGASEVPAEGDAASTTDEADSAILGTLDSGADSDADADATDASVTDAAALPPPPDADWDAPVPSGVIGKTYAETSYSVLAPQGLATAFNILASSPGSTRVFVNDIRQGADGGAEVRYGAASPVADAGLAWQEATPHTFAIAPAVAAADTLVSEPFTYSLYARVPNPTNANTMFLLRLDAVDAVWTATTSSDYEHLTAGTLYGTVTRAEAEMRPLKLGLGCIAICADVACAAGAGITTLAQMLDCTNTPKDADVDGDGTADGYKLAISFASERIDFAAAGQ